MKNNKFCFPFSFVTPIVVLLLSMQAVASDTQFTHKHLTLDLPGGWTVAELPTGSSEETIGYIKSDTFAGSSMTVMCYRGMLHTLASTRIRGLNVISATYPKGQEHLKEPEKIKTKGGKGEVELWRGYIDAGSMTVALISPMATIKTKHCWMSLTGFAPDKAGEKFFEAVKEVVKTAR